MVKITADDMAHYLVPFGGVLLMGWLPLPGIFVLTSAWVYQIATYWSKRDTLAKDLRVVMTGTVAGAVALCGARLALRLLGVLET